MTDDEVIDLVHHLRELGHDDAHTEAKTCAQKLTNDIWPSVSAFANTHGGVIILGLEEKKNFTVPRGFSSDLVIDQFVSGVGDGGAVNAKLTSPPHYELERHPFEGSEIVVIEISELGIRNKPCFVTNRHIVGGSYKRVDDKDVPLSPTEIYELQNSLLISSADKEFVPEAQLEDLDKDLIEQIVAHARQSIPKALRGVSTTEQALRRLNITGKNDEIRMAGLLVAGSYPQQFFPKLIVDIATHPDNEKSSPGRPRFLDRVQCEGPVGEVIEDALQAVAKNLRTYSIIEGVGRRDELEIPREVLREAIANAVVHREYGPLFLGQAISIDIYPNRVEITNPGGLWGGKTKENLADGTSRCRNETLMKLMELTELPREHGRPAEGNGSGISLMIREMRARALSEPEFEPGFDCFTVTLGRSGTEIPEFIAWVNEVAGGRLPQEEEALLLTLRRNPGLTVNDLRKKMEMDSDDIRSRLADLKLRGIVGEDSNGRHSILEEGTSTKASWKDLAPREAILSYLRHVDTASAREIAEELGRSLDNTRYHINRLLNGGLIIATAPSTSKNRKYRLNL